MSQIPVVYLDPNRGERQLVAADIAALNVPVTGGSINNAPIGGTTPAAGAFTTLAASGASTLAAVTATTLAASGIVTLGAVGNALTAVGTNRSTALALTNQINNITTAAAGTGVTLPAGVPGNIILVFNAGANAAQVYGAGSDTVDGVAGSTGVPLTNAKRAVFICVAANTYISAQLGVVSA